MFARLHRGYVGLLTSGGQLLLLFVAARIHTLMAWRISLSLIAILSLFAWLSVLRRERAVIDTPVSFVASAAQGYVELRGHGRPLDGLPVLAPLTNLPCLWYRFHVERRNGDKWVTDSSGESNASFLLEDSTGACVVDPEGAEIMPLRCDTWQKDNYRYSQWLILKDDHLYLIGGFRTQSAGAFDVTMEEEVKNLLSDWKQDMPALLKRFDLNKDGSLDMVEWDLARSQARREVERNRREESLNKVELHFVSKPDDGRLYLISTLSEDKLVRRYRIWSWVHVTIFFAALIGLAKISSLTL
jgi:hypothetical protein